MRMVSTKSFVRSYHEELQFYSEYHQQPVNWLIHAVMIPCEWSSWLLLLSPSTGLLTFMVLLTAGYHIPLLWSHPMTAGAALTFHVAAGLSVSTLTSRIGDWWMVWGIGVAVQAVAWFVQVHIGHHYFERNQPAFVSKLTLSAVLWSVMLAWDARPKRCLNLHDD